MSPSRRVLTACSIAMLAATSACGSGQDDASDGRLDVTTSFYPLEYAVEQVGGEHVDVTNLTRPGAEPHDLELSPRQILEVTKADQLVYLEGFQPSVDEAATEAGDTAFDVSPAARLHIESHHEDGHGQAHDHGGRDPHFWLDPTRYADVATAIGEQLAKADPDHADAYRANAKDFADRLDTLDGELRTGLTSCRSHDLVTGHASFAYFADRYHFRQESVAGLSPQAEASPKEMSELVQHIEDEGVTTVYAETLVPRDLAETIAREAGAEVAVLDPIEGITDESAGEDYFEVMHSNLEVIQEGQRCS